ADATFLLRRDESGHLRTCLRCPRPRDTGHVGRAEGDAWGYAAPHPQGACAEPGGVRAFVLIEESRHAHLPPPSRAGSAYCLPPTASCCRHAYVPAARGAGAAGGIGEQSAARGDPG